MTALAYICLGSVAMSVRIINDSASASMVYLNKIYACIFRHVLYTYAFFKRCCNFPYYRARRECHRAAKAARSSLVSPR